MGTSCRQCSKSIALAVALLVIGSFDAANAQAQSVGGQSDASAFIRRALSERVGRDVGSDATKAERRAGTKNENITAFLIGGLAGMTLMKWVRGNTTVSNGVAVTTAAVSPEGSTAALALENGQISIWDMAKGRQIARTKALSDQIARIAIADVDTFMLASKTGEVLFVDETRLLSLGQKCEVTALRLNNDASLAAIGCANGAIEIYNLRTMKRDLQLAGAGRILSLELGRDATQPIAAINDAGTVYSWVNGAIVRQFRASARLTAADFPRGPNQAAVLKANGKLAHLNLQNGVISGDVSAKSFSNSIALVGDGLTALSIANDAAELVQLSDGASLARLIVTDQGWAVLDKTGRFDGNNDGLRAVSWSAPNVSLDLAAFAKTYFEPGILTKRIQGEALSRLQARAIDDGIALPPLVSVVVESERPNAEPGRPMMVVVLAEDRGGGIQDVRLFHNGKVVDPGALIQAREYLDRGRTIRASAFMVTPAAGFNTLRATAVGEGGIEGASIRKTIKFAGVRARGALHVVTVGLNQYPSPLPALDLAVTDASGFGNAFSASQQFEKVQRRDIADASATKAGVLAALRDVVVATRPEDTLVVFLAGHGLSTDADQWVFATVDVDVTSASRIVQTGLTASEISDILVSAPARHVILAIDSCQSAGAFGAFMKQRELFLRAFSDVSRTTGVIVYAATQETQSANESSRLGHGLFTYSFIQGMAGAAGNGSGGVITAFQMADYLEDAVPKLAAQYVHGAQDTATFRLGADFPLR